MNDCPSCHDVQMVDLPERQVVTCTSETCDCLFWMFQNQTYFVPHLENDHNTGRQGFRKAVYEDECGWFNSKSVVFSRINEDLSYIRFETQFAPSLTPVTNENQRNQRILDEINAQLSEFGLRTCRLSTIEFPRGNDPFIIHRMGDNPLEFEREFVTIPFLNQQDNPNLDPRWIDWESSLQQNLQNMGQKLSGQHLKPEQNKTLRTMLKTPASLTIGALPTGFGKSRIMQVAASLLNHGAQNGLNNDQGSSGPVLIISPLISLRDDQRMKWEEYNQTLNPGISHLRCRFLTSTNPRSDDDVIHDLMQGDVDVLCCSPDLFFDVNIRRPAWLECFQSMPRPFSALMIDEAHVIGDWGASIIPAFQLLPTIKNQLLIRNPELRLLLLSATISVEEEKELIKLFREGMVLPPLVDGTYAIRKSKSRLGLVFDVEAPKSVKSGGDEVVNYDTEIIHFMREKKIQIPVRWQRKHGGAPFEPVSRPPIILYTYRQQKAKDLKQSIQALGHTAAEYIGSSSSHHRDSVLTGFKNNQLAWVIGTSAFGMGVDKDDIWVVGYLGIPSSLKELYQSFGRAARYDDWDYAGSRKNGYCKGLLIGRSEPFKPKMKLPLTMERIMRSLLHPATKWTRNGYVLLDVESVIVSVWSTGGVAEQPEDEEDLEGITSEYGLHRFHQERLLRRFQEGSAESMQTLRSRTRSVQENSNLFLWALACAQRSELLEVCGIHPKILYSTPSQDYSLLDVLEDDSGYRGVLDALRMQRSRGGSTPANQKRFVVVRIKQQNSIDYDSLFKHVRQGHDDLKSRFERGIRELNDFRNAVRKGATCMRKLFSSCYGSTPQNTRSCLEHLSKKEHAMPCNVCMKGLARGPNPVPHIWSEPHHFESLFNHQWPQTNPEIIELFRKPTQQNNMVATEYNFNPMLYITGDFHLTNAAIDADLPPEMDLYSGDDIIGLVRVSEGNIVHVEHSTDEPISWQDAGRQAFSVNYTNGSASIFWEE
jgi:superfamily II DNA or RNA helicase